MYAVGYLNKQSYIELCLGNDSEVITFAALNKAKEFLQECLKKAPGVLYVVKLGQV